ncbi:hypothetical protein B7486_54055 [cyanobacterium TDX16]|nr:hypothetical protein B7486_54055 [cyanobacterium TDX16]
MNDGIFNVTHLDISSAHSELIDLLKQIATGKPIILHQNGEQVAALVSIEDLHLLERLIEEEEDRLDVADAQTILAEAKEQGTVPWEEIKARLKL